MLRLHLATLVCGAFMAMAPSARAEDETEGEAEREELMRQIEAQLGKDVGPPRSRAGGPMLFAGIGLAAGTVRMSENLRSDLTGAELIFGGGYRWAVTTRVDLRVAGTISFTFPNPKPMGTEVRPNAAGTPSVFDRSGTEPSMTTLGSELVARAHFTRESHVFFGLGPRLGVRWSSSDVRSTLRSNPFGESSMSTARRTDFIGQGVFELGAEIGSGRHVDLTARLSMGVDSSGAEIFGFGIATGVVF